MSRIKISVIIPVYNAEQNIKKCLTSILEQDLEEIEVICIDDASQDDSFAVLEEEAKTDGRIVVLRNEHNEGTLVSRKRGVSSARGEYVMFADNDDRYLPNVFGKLYSEIKERNVDILMYGFRPVRITRQDGREIIKEQFREYAIPKREHYIGENCIHIENRLNLLWNKIINAEVCKQAYSNIQDIHMTIAEDTYACWLIHYYGKSFAAIEDVCYEWNCSDGTSTYNDQSYALFKNLCKCMKDYENCVVDFLRSQNEPELLDYFRNEKKVRGYNYILDKWRKTVPVENADEGLRAVIDIYGDEKVYQYIFSEWNGLDTQVREIGSLKARNKQLSSTIKKIKQSKSYRIGRLFTWIPRTIHRIIKNLAK